MRSLLARKPRRQIFEGRQTRIRRPLLAVTLNQVPVAAANRTEPETSLATQRLHRQGQRRLGLAEDPHLDLVLVVEVDVPVLRGGVAPVPGGGGGRGPHACVPAALSSPVTRTSTPSRSRLRSTRSSRHVG